METTPGEPLHNGLVWWSRRRSNGDHVLVHLGREIGPGMTGRQAKALAEWCEASEHGAWSVSVRLLDAASRTDDEDDRATLMLAAMLLRGECAPITDAEARRSLRNARDAHGLTLYDAT